MVKVDLNGIGVIFGLAGVAYGVYSAYKAKSTYDKVEEVCNNLDVTIENMAKNITVDVPNNVVDLAIEKSVNYYVEKETKKAAEKAVISINEDISKQVKDAVDKTYVDVKRKVSDEVAEQVALIDINDLRKDVREKAEKNIVSKFNGELDDLLEKYNNDLKNVSNIYRSIANTLNPNGTSNSNSGYLFKL